MDLINKLLNDLNNACHINLQNSDKIKLEILKEIETMLEEIKIQAESISNIDATNHKNYNDELYFRRFSTYELIKNIYLETQNRKIKEEALRIAFKYDLID